MSEASRDAGGTVITGSGKSPDPGAPARGRPGRRRLRVLVAAGAVVAVAAGVTTMLLAVSPGDPPPSALAALTAALAKTSGESYGFSLDSTVTYAGKMVDANVVSGAYDPRNKLGTELLTGRSARPSHPRHGAQIRFIGEYVYTWVSEDSGFRTIGTPWDKAPLPPAAASVLSADDPYGFATDWPVSPDELLAALRSTATVRNSGPVSGPGWTGIRYTFTSRPSPMWSVTGTAYVDNQGRVRRLMTTATAKGGVTTERDFTFRGFGAPVLVTAPAAAQTRYTDSVRWFFFF
jgi:hypothetical protein